jgi:hypothetical protein
LKGLHEVTLLMMDWEGQQDTDTVLVSVRDTVAPSLFVRPRPSYLWPPTHRMRRVELELEVSDACDPSHEVALVAATSSEPDDAPGGRDGKTRDDIQGADLGTPDTEVFLRAERMKKGPGPGLQPDLRGEGLRLGTCRASRRPCGSPSRPSRPARRSRPAWPSGGLWEVSMQKWLWTLLLAAAVPAGAADYYVHPEGGDDANPGTLARPFKTLSHAVTVAASGSDVIHALAGQAARVRGSTFDRGRGSPDQDRGGRSSRT